MTTSVTLVSFLFQVVQVFNYIGKLVQAMFPLIARTGIDLSVGKLY